MEPIAITFALIGALVAVVGSIMLLVAAFRVSVLWGLANLFIPFASLVFLFMHWEEARRGFLLSLLGTIIAFGAIFSSPSVRGGIKTAQAAMNGARVEKEEPKELNAKIEVKRVQIEQMESQLQQQAPSVAVQYQALDARRRALKTDDAAAVTAFNAEAAAYQQANNSLKQLQQQIATAREELTKLLDERSRAQASPGQPAASRKGPFDFRQAFAATNQAKAANAARVGGGVVIYTTSHCGWCTRAKQYFAQKGVQYEERDVERDSAAKKEFQRLGGRGVPLIMVGSEKIEGFDQQRLDQLL